MSNEAPVCFSEILLEEQRALRPNAPTLEFDSNAPECARREQLFRAMHAAAPPRRALCISGGGIRSATFALGAVQGLADHGLLDQFDYLSTVSGGGYIGSWLTSWAHRAGGIDAVAARLRRDCPAPPPEAPDPVQHLRDFSNYLTPKLGAFSADAWTLIATVLRNIILNWLVLVPLLLFVLMIPRLLEAIVYFGHVDAHHPNTALWAWLAKFTWYLAAACFATAVYNMLRFLPAIGGEKHTQGQFVRGCLIPLIGASVLLSCHYSWWHWEILANQPPSFLQCIADAMMMSFSGWLVFLVLKTRKGSRVSVRMFAQITLALGLVSVFTGISIWSLMSGIFQYESLRYSHFVTLGAPLLILGFMLAGSLFVGLTSDVLTDEDREWMSRAGAFFLMFVMIWTAGCTLVLLVPAEAFGWHRAIHVGLGALGAGSAWIAALAGFAGENRKPTSKADQPRPLPIRLGQTLAPPVFVVLFLVGLSVMTNWLLAATHLIPTSAAWWDHSEVLTTTSIVVNLLFCAGFLGLGLVMSRFINVNRFSLHAMYRDRLIRAYLGASNPARHASPFTGLDETDNLRMCELDPRAKPFHVLNLTLNLTSGHRLAWQQRKAESFTVSPLHSGAVDLGYRSSTEYGDGISLGGAMTISGAAASPNMGYHSSPVLGFIMTLFNARLGAWMGNPAACSGDAWKHSGPTLAAAALIKESLGLSDNTSSYVYLSDGGHFENLGLYEMVLRRCRSIIVLDAGCDPDFKYEDLGNALRKIRIDLKIPIEFDDELMAPLHNRKKRCAVGRIVYSAVDGPCADGFLLYIKPLCLGDEPPDVLSFRATASSFPHQSTSDQWFNESQTESYRMLGLHTLDEICRNWKGATLEDLRDHVERVYLGRQASAGASA
jgi:hypothetical protein